MIIKDLDVEYKIPNLEEFKNHIKKYHTVNENPMAVYEENGYYFRVDYNFYKELFV